MNKFTPFTFNSRETYLAFRKEWKEEYLKVSKEIRESKNESKNMQREGRHSYSVYAKLAANRRVANELLETLKEAKQKAQQQYMEQQGELA
ncbi:MAG TPA: hypothetical protein VFM18_19390 [Methanosarcina sp.]|nr:hypothetical protein [Methanosarcina sp.]